MKCTKNISSDYVIPYRKFLILYDFLFKKMSDVTNLFDYIYYLKIVNLKNSHFCQIIKKN